VERRGTHRRHRFGRLTERPNIIAACQSGVDASLCRLSPKARTQFMVTKPTCTGHIRANPFSVNQKLETCWPHAPPHRLGKRGAYFVTASTYKKLHHFSGKLRLGV